MRLDDIRLKQNLLHVPTRKGGHSTIYPLSAPVGEAIIEYLRRDRPAVDDRHLFLLARAPYLPVSHWVISERRADAFAPSASRWRGPGRTRFATAASSASSSRHAVQDHWRLRRPQLAEVDPRLRQVALHKLRQLTLGEAEDML